jgi:hypothetical protein
MTLRTTTGRVRLGATLAATTMLVWGVLALKVKLRSLDSPTIIWFRMGVSAWTIGGAATVVGGSLLVALGGRSCLTLIPRSAGVVSRRLRAVRALERRRCGGGVTRRVAVAPAPSLPRLSRARIATGSK